MSLRRFWAILNARNLEFWRDRAALSWNVIFPVLVVAGFAFAFSGQAPDLFKVGIYGTSPHKTTGFLATEYIRQVPIDDLQRAVTKVQRHQLDMLLDVDKHRYWINRESPNGYMLERVLQGTEVQAWDRQTVKGRPIRYVDWVLPGVLAMNLMFSALFGIGYVIVRYRKNGVLKRLKATPLSALEFLAAQVVSRLWLIMLLTTAVFIGTDIFIDFAMFGSYLLLFCIFALGAFSMISLGLLVASRTASEELAGGLLNLLSWPMMFLSGVWFSLEGVNPWLQKLALVFPLTHLIDAARAVMIDGAGLPEVAGHLLVLAVMSALFLLIGSLTFRWE